MNNTETTYRNLSIAGASPIGLVLALFDRLVADFQSAASAIRRNDIETRCRELNHASLIIGQLESWLDTASGDESVQNLARFYAFLRAKMLEASAKKSVAVLEAQIEVILHIRSAWQQLDSAPRLELDDSARPANQYRAQAYGQPAEVVGDRVPFSQCV